MGILKEFHPLEQETFSETASPSLKNRTVIKNQFVKLHSPIKIEVDEINYQEDRGDLVEPVLENGDVVGLVHRCSCGKVMEIRFEYE